MYLESLGDARSIVVLAVKSCSKAFLHLLRGMEKVHAFWTVFFEGCWCRCAGVSFRCCAWSCFPKMSILIWKVQKKLLKPKVKRLFSSLFGRSGGS